MHTGLAHEHEMLKKRCEELKACLKEVKEKCGSDSESLKKEQGMIGKLLSISCIQILLD